MYLSIGNDMAVRDRSIIGIFDMDNTSTSKRTREFLAKAEKEANARPAIKGKVENMEQYDVVFIGAPVWWYTGPMAIYTFMEQYDLKGKTVIPFCTAYSGPSQTLKDIVKSTPDSDHRDGICIVTKELGGQGMESKTAKIDKWLGEIGF